MSKLDRLNELEAKKQSVLQGGGKDKIDKQHADKKMTARERISKLLDDKSFIETDAFAELSAAAEGFEAVSAAGEGVVTGYGTINSRPVYVFSQDFTVLSGSLGYMHTQKILKVLDMAGKQGVPVVGILDSAGARLGEGAASLNGLSKIMKKMTTLSGVVPMISIVAGPCAGSASYLTALSDFVFAVDNIGGIYNSSPGVFGEDANSVGGAMALNEKSGLAHFFATDENTCFVQVKTLMEYLPFNNVEDAPIYEQTDDLNRPLQGLDTASSVDTKEVITAIADNAQFLEVQAYFSTNVIIGFIRLNGFVTGVVANNGGSFLCAEAAEKAARFIRFCDAYNTPILTLADTQGYAIDADAERNGQVKDGAKLIYAYAEASVPMVTVICGNAIGSGFVSMCPKGLGADMVYAWPDAVISCLPAKTAVDIIMTQDLKKADNPMEKREELNKLYAEKFANPFEAAKQGAIDDIIAPSATRQRVIAGLEMAFGKRDMITPKKHGVMPL
jgi:methylmalonyl-CoA decarboxylase subunit alpha